MLKNTPKWGFRGRGIKQNNPQIKNFKKFLNFFLKIGIFFLNYYIFLYKAFFVGFLEELRSRVKYMYVVF
ncbi:hypothetical protein AF78_04260 [Aliarcobacter butzleri L353]|nr:hypothetical protein AF78_04260 [Aliarcobacter butzleri L353]